MYQSTFAPSTTWSDNYACGAEIKAYWKSLVAKYHVDQYIRFNTVVTRAEWSESKGLWLVETQSEGRAKTLEAKFLITATGHFSSPQLPDIPGLKDFEGHLRHSSEWDNSFDPAGKRIAVIGNGASGLQVVPPLQKVADQLDHYARSRTWIAGSFGGEDLSRDTREAAPQDPEEYIKFRRDLEKSFFSTFGVIIKDSAKNKAAKLRLEKLMRERLGSREDLLEAIKPDFPVNCRRLTPGPGYLEALSKPNVGYISTKIERFTSTGIQLVDGTSKDYDAIICSTGANISYTPVFPLIANGVNLQDAWAASGSPGFPDTYLGMAAPNFPNLLCILGPNSAGLGGTIPNVIENEVTYIAKILRKVSGQGIRSITPTQDATNDFRAYCESFFPRTVLSENCRSWYNGGIPGGRICGIWPGSGTHANAARRDVRWEDFTYTYESSSRNRFAWLGDGTSRKDVDAAKEKAEQDITIDYTPYLKKESVEGTMDLRAIHETWYEI